MIRENLGMEAAYKGYPISITKDGDVIISCGSTSAASNFLKTLPGLKIEQKTYKGKPHVETYSEQELVTCEYCKYWRKLALNMDGDGVCRNNKMTNGRVTSPNWFCADGERE